jgi:hypothetical protein
MGELYFECGPGSSVGIVTSYRMDGAGIESRWGARFSAPVQTDPGARPTSCTIMGTGSFPGVKSGRGVTLTPHHLLVTLSTPSMGLTAYTEPQCLYKGALYLLFLYFESRTCIDDMHSDNVTFTYTLNVVSECYFRFDSTQTLLGLLSI